MFTATKQSISFQQGVFQVVVEYQNGSDVFVKAYNINSEDDLNNRIENELNTLNRLLELTETLSLGAWSKPVKVTPPPPTALELAKQKLYDLKEKVNLGVLKETDQEFVDAVAAYKLAEGK
jgi:hypothetical protein